MKNLAVLPFAFVTLYVMECFVSANLFELQTDPGEEEHNGRYMDFPRDLEEKDVEDGMVENVEEGFDIPTKDLENSKGYPAQNFKFHERDEAKEIFENSRIFSEMNSQTPENGLIKVVKVEAKIVYNVLSSEEGQSSSYGTNPQLLIVLKNGREYRAELKNKKDAGKKNTIILRAKTDFTPQLICTHGDIDKVYIEARGGDGWYVVSIETYTAGSNNFFTKLTTDPSFGLWVDGGEEDLYPYNTKKHLLTNAAAKLIEVVKVIVRTGYDPLRSGEGQSPSYGANPRLLIVLKDGGEYRAELKYDKYQGYEYFIELYANADFTPHLSCTRRDINKVYLEASGKDGWYVASIDTYTAGSHEFFTELTTDPGFNMWVVRGKGDLYPYKTEKLLLTNAIAGSCITYIRVDALTGDKFGADSSYSYNKYRGHWIVLILSNNQTFQAELEGPMKKGQSYVRELNFASRFGTTRCVSLSDIKEIHLKASSHQYEDWYISSIRTSAKTGLEQYMDLTSDPNLNKWLRGFDIDEIKLNWVNQETLNCEYGNPTCECIKHARVCKFNLEVEEIRTFTSYQKLIVDEPTGLMMRGSQGVIYYFGDDGSRTPLQDNRTCSTQDSAKCTNPQFVDGKTYRLAIAVNGQIPGPTLIVHEGQTVEIRVQNKLTTEGISIHWHGMHQRGTPWMDGVGQVTQCQTAPSSTFTYVYKAEPAGTFWYHSHSGAQRTDGLFGGLVVKESPEKMTQIRSKLERLETFLDLPDQHTLTVLDWQQEASLDLFTQIHGSLGFYPGKPPGEVPTRADLQRLYEFTSSYEGAEVGPVPYFSGIINGKGRHDDVPYIKTKLSIFTVQAGMIYRFRLIGAQNLYAYKFSIDGHKLSVVGTDGYWIKPVEDVDYIIIHTGERFDFLLEASNTRKDYWMRAETLEIDHNGQGPPYKSLGHVAEAILHYEQDGDSADPNANVPSTKYEDIKNSSPVRQCSADDPCKAVNCPFEKFDPLYYITCVNVQHLRLLEPTPHAELPNAIPKTPWQCPNCRHFINFNFEGESQTSAVNGRNFILPAFPPLTQNEEFQKKDNICDLNSDCNPSTPDCSCVHVINIPYNETVQLVFSAIGAFDSAHPIHLHGHSFHVVAVGYPQYANETGFIAKHNSDIFCDDVNCIKENCDKEECTRPSWNGNMSFSIDSYTIRKDTVMVPAGGYVVINFLSDNPGYWFLHCHIEVHQLEGMAIIVNEAPDAQSQLKPPKEMNKCGDVEISVPKYKKKSHEFP